MTRKIRVLGGLLCLAVVLTVGVVVTVGHPPMVAPRKVLRAPRPTPVAPQTIVALGDSVTYGAHDTVHGGWVTRLDRLLAATYPHSHVCLRDLAHNGGHTADLIGDVRRLRRGRRPDLVIVAYGLNDFDEHIPATVLAAHLRAGGS